MDFKGSGKFPVDVSIAIDGVPVIEVSISHGDLKYCAKIIVYSESNIGCIPQTIRNS